MNNIKDKLTVWLQNNIDFALFLAVFTETPRWTVVFVAVHESVFIGIPLGVRQLTPEGWVEARRQRAAARTEQAATEAAACPASTLQ